MAFHPDDSTVTLQPRRRRHWLGRSLVAVIVLVIFAALLFYGLGAWLFSNEIRDGALAVEPPSTPSFDIEVVGVAVGTLTLSLTSENDHLLGSGIRGVSWPGGYGQVSEILSSDDDSITRTYTGDVDPGEGTLVDLDGYAYPSDPDAAFGIGYQEVSYDSELGPIGAWYVPGRTDVWVIYVHGRNAPRREALRMLPIIAERGHHSLVIDYRNDPGAPADPSGFYQFGRTEWADVAAALRYARAAGAERIVLVGYSMGGGIVTSFMLQSPLNRHVAAVILDAPMLDFEAVVDFAAEDATLPIVGATVPSSLLTFSKWLADLRFDIGWDELDYLSRASELRRPILVFHGAADDRIPVALSRSLAANRPDLVTYVETADAGHVLSWNLDPDRYADAVRSFLDQHVGG